MRGAVGLLCYNGGEEAVGCEEPTVCESEEASGSVCQTGLLLGLEGYVRMDSLKAVTHLFSVRGFFAGGRTATQTAAMLVTKC